MMVGFQLHLLNIHVSSNESLKPIVFFCFAAFHLPVMTGCNRRSRTGSREDSAIGELRVSTAWLGLWYFLLYHILSYLISSHRYQFHSSRLMRAPSHWETGYLLSYHPTDSASHAVPQPSDSICTEIRPYIVNRLFESILFGFLVYDWWGY